MSTFSISIDKQGPKRLRTETAQGRNKPLLHVKKEKKDICTSFFKKSQSYHDGVWLRQGVQCSLFMVLPHCGITSQTLYFIPRQSHLTTAKICVPIGGGGNKYWQYAGRCIHIRKYIRTGLDMSYSPKISFYTEQEQIVFVCLKISCA